MVRNKVVYLVFLAAIMAPLLCPSAMEGQEKSSGRTASEKFLARIDFRSWMTDFLTISPDSRHVTCAVKSLVACYRLIGSQFLY
ncbi:hypothetical protein ACFL6S_31240 [Candidatus Poribacteria bacterium]